MNFLSSIKNLNNFNNTSTNTLPDNIPSKLNIFSSRNGTYVGILAENTARTRTILYISSNSGRDFIEKHSFNVISLNNLKKARISDDGIYIMIINYEGKFYFSTNSGTTFTMTSLVVTGEMNNTGSIIVLSFYNTTTTSVTENGVTTSYYPIDIKISSNYGSTFTSLTSVINYKDYASQSLTTLAIGWTQAHIYIYMNYSGSRIIINSLKGLLMNEKNSLTRFYIYTSVDNSSFSSSYRIAISPNGDYIMCWNGNGWKYSYYDITNHPLMNVAPTLKTLAVDTNTTSYKIYESNQYNAAIQCTIPNYIFIDDNKNVIIATSYENGQKTDNAVKFTIVGDSFTNFETVLSTSKEIKRSGTGTTDFTSNSQQTYINLIVVNSSVVYILYSDGTFSRKV